MKKLYKNLVAMALFVFGVTTASAQVSYTQDFTAGISSWTGGWSTTTTNSCVGNSPRKNIYTVGTQAAFTSPSLGTSNGGVVAMSFDYKVINWSGGAATPNTFGTITVEYATSAAGPWTATSMVINTNHIPSTTCANKSLNFSPPAGALFVRFNCTWNTGDYYVYFDDIIITQGPPPSCAAPTALTATNISAASADLAWTNATGSLWNVEFGVSPYTSTGTATAGYGNLTNGGNGVPVTVTGLTPNTTYQYYVQSDCGGGDMSSWSGPFTFTTPCASVVAPWTETFGTATVIPACWSQSAGNAESWRFSTTASGNHIGNNGTLGAAVTASGGAFAWVDDSSPHSSNTGLETPYIDITALTYPTLSFYLISNNEGITNVNFSVDVWDGSAWILDVYTSNSNTLNGEWELINVYLSGITFSGDMKLRFVVDETNGTDFYDDIAIDDISVFDGPACPDPSSLMTTWVDNDSVIFSWAAGNTESNWNVEVGTVGFVPGTGVAVYTGTSIVTADTASGLSQTTDYEIYVQADCGGGDMSTWVGPITFTSLPNCSAPSNLVANVLTPDSVELIWTGGSTGETDWTIAYGLNPYTPGDVGGTMVSVSTNSIDTIGGLTQNSTYDFYVLGNCSLSDSSLWVGPETVTTPLFCNNVNTLSATTVIDTAFLSWTAGSNGETMWNVEYGPSGFVLGTGISYSTMNNNTDTLVGLMGSSTYQYYVQAACASGDTSLFTGPFTFTMPLTNDEPCDAILLPVDGVVRMFTGTGSTAAPTEQADLAIPGSNCSSNDAWCNSNVNFSTWFTFVAPASGNVIVSSTATTADGQLALFEVTDCMDFTTFDLIAANDDYAGLAPEISACGLTPGNTYYVIYDPWSSSSAIANFAMQITEVSLDAGVDGAATVCASEGVDLNSIATILDATGTWSFDLNPSAIFDDSLFNAASVPVGTHVVTYNVSAGCAADSVTATLTIIAPGQSGTAVTPFTMCNAGDVFLPNGLTGVVESGGTWSDDSGTGMLGGVNNNVFIANGLPVGTYPFTYTVSNGVCPNAATTITVTLTNCTSVEENNMEVSVYPNPNNGTFNILTDVSESVLITVMDVQGKMVYNNKVNLSAGIANEVNVGSVETGLYILKVSSENYVSTSTFVIK